jgi:hypothetical protein
MTYIPDPIELGESRAERWAETHLRGDEFKCLKCDNWFPIDSGVTMTIDPYSPLVCWDCSGFAVGKKGDV